MPQGISSVVLPILARGVGVGGIVWAAFGVPERVLNEDTKLRIGIWLLDVNRDLQSRIQTWPDTFANLFDRVFGERHLSWRCFSHSALASYFALLLTGFFLEGIKWELLPRTLFDVFRYGFIGNVLPDYVSLLETRYVMSLMQRTESSWSRRTLVVVDLLATSLIATLTAHIILSYWWVGDNPRSWDWSLSGILSHPFDFHQNHSWISFVIPAFLTSVWLWLYAGSGFLIRAAHRFNLGFAFFNQHFDIEKKPLQAIGLVAASLAASVYWAAILVHSIVG